jgi:hypothetical protein
MNLMGIYLKDFFSTFSQWVSFPFVDIIFKQAVKHSLFEKEVKCLFTIV